MKTNDSRPTQEDLIMGELARANGDWVSMRHLARISRSMNVHSRIARLRDVRCAKIENKLKPGRPTKSWYRLATR